MLTTRVNVKFHTLKDTVPNKTALASDANYRFKDPQTIICLTNWLQTLGVPTTCTQLQ